MPNSNLKSIKNSKKKNKVSKKKQLGGDTVCSNLYPKSVVDNVQLVTNENIGGPSPVNANNKILSCSLPTPRAPAATTPPIPVTENMPMDGSPSPFLGRPPPRVPPAMPGPPGPGAYKPGLAGIPVLSSTTNPPQATTILNDIINRGTVNRDYQPILNSNLITNSTCTANPNKRNHVGGQRKHKKKKSLKRKVKRKSRATKN